MRTNRLVHLKEIQHMPAQQRHLARRPLASPAVGFSGDQHSIDERRTATGPTIPQVGTPIDDGHSFQDMTSINATIAGRRQSSCSTEASGKPPPQGHVPRRRYPEAGSRIERRAFGVNEACQALGLSRSTIYKLIATERLRSVRVAGRRLIPADAVEALVAEGA
jgi:excisionase family DNA binding protein